MRCLFIIAIRSLLRLAEIFRLRGEPVSTYCWEDYFNGHSESGNHSVEDREAWDYHTIFYALG